MNTVIVVVVLALALGGMYYLNKSVQKKNERPKTKPPKDGKPVGDEPKELP
jgi:uncharacterized protein YdgA (DUF945 family)